MDFNAISNQLLKELGGKDNIAETEACTTRLRVSIKDMSKVNLQAIRETEGVLGVIESETLQIVFGPGTVNKVYEAFNEACMADNKADSTKEKADAFTVAKENKAEQRQKYDKPLLRFLKKIASIFIPLLPGIVAAGLINGVTNVINFATKGALSGIWWYECIRTMGWALFTYLPIYVGMLAAKEMGGSAILGGIAGAMCISNASMPLLTTFGDKQVTLPFTGAVYVPGNGGIIAAVIASSAFALLEKKIRKIMPDLLDTFISPLLVLIIGSLAIILVIQPISSWLANVIYKVIETVYDKMGMIGGYILSAGFLPLVAVGLHQALVPIHVMLNDPSGPTKGINYLFPVLMMSGGGQVGAGLALYFKTKNKKLKRFIRDSIPVGILGVGEPLMYAVTLPLGRSFLTACIGAGFGGALAAAFHLGAVSQGLSGLFGLLIVQPGQQIQYVIAMLAAYLGGFVLTWFFGVDEKKINEIYSIK